MITIKKVHHYALSVENLKATADWYMQTFDFTLERQFGFPDLGIEIVHLISANGIRIELLHSTKSQQSADVGKDAFGAIENRGSKHIGLQVDNIQEVADKLKAKRVAVLHDVTTVEMAGVTNFWILDNEGNQIELAEPIQ
jgi:catechol 2,3-dioxygenase-like lactoylglutathione lyase family enzyme